MHVSWKWETRKGAQNHMHIMHVSYVSHAYRVCNARTGQISLQGPSRSNLGFLEPKPFFLGEAGVDFVQIKLYHTYRATNHTYRD